MDVNTLRSAMGNTPGVDYGALAEPMNKALEIAQINNPRRLAMWCAQLGHESVGLRYMNEIWGPTAAQRTYDGRMGNRPGTSDWSDFRGRGPIQLTGRNNYASFYQWARDKGLNPPDFTREPYRVAESYWGFLAAAWYWTVARPQLNSLADAEDVVGATRAINGGTNGLADRQQRYNNCIGIFSSGGESMEKVLDYSRLNVKQDTYYNCGPASTQTVVLSATGRLVGEGELGQALRTSVNGTDYIGLVAPVLNQYVPNGEYVTKDMPNDPPSQSQKDELWNDIKGSIDVGRGVVANIVAPPSNYPRAVSPSTISPAYGGGTVYHYIAVMGYTQEASGFRRYWVADSGFTPYGYWISHDQLASLIPPKGYAYSISKNKEDDVANADVNQIKNEISDVKRMLNDLLMQFSGPKKDWKGWPANKEWPGTQGEATVQNIVNRLDRIEKATNGKARS